MKDRPMTGNSIDESNKTRGATPADGTPRRTPAQMILRWTALGVLGILATGALIFVGDTAVFFLRGKPSEQIVVTRYMAAPLKGNNTEFYYEGTGPEPCAKSLFAQNGWSPCWYLRRHPMYAEPA